jgi:RNase adaptor protein for sRNA GlmZ degradation
VTIESMLCPHVTLLSKITPRYFTSFTQETIDISMRNFGYKYGSSVGVDIPSENALLPVQYHGPQIVSSSSWVQT